MLSIPAGIGGETGPIISGGGAIPGGGIPGGAIPGGGIPGGGIPGGGPIGIGGTASCWANTGCNKARTPSGVSAAALYPTKSASSSRRASIDRMFPRKLFIKISGESGVRDIITAVSASSDVSPAISSSVISAINSSRSSINPDIIPTFSTSSSSTI